MSKSYNILLFMIIFLSGIIVIPGAVSAANNGSVYVSTSGNDSWDGLTPSTAKLTIKNATGTVATNGTVHVASGTYRENQINITKSMNIIGENRGNTIINGTYSGNIFNIISGVTVTMESLTLTNGNATRYQTPRPPYIDIIVSYGGAINNRGILTIKNSLFKNNGELGNDYPEPGELQLWTYGGAIYNYFGGTLSVDNCEFINNTSDRGGSINNNGTLNVKNTVFTNNNVTGNGGAIYNTGTATVNYSLFSSNTGSNGAICNNGNLIVFSSIFTNNTALSGGAIFTQGYLKVTNSTFINNTSNYYSGGAIYAYGDSIVNFNRFVGNTAESGIGNIITNEGNMDARYNWWGSNNPNSDRTDFNTGPGIFLYDPWIVLTVTVSPGNVQSGGVSNVTADLLHDNQGDLHGVDDGLIPYSGPANFIADDGTIVDAFFVNGIARTTLNVGSTQGRLNVSATVDGETITNGVYVGLATVNPANGSIVPKNQNITITFSEPIMIGPGFNNITVTDKNGNEKDIKLTINGVELIISPVGGWDSGGRYTLELPSNAVTSTGGDLLTLPLTSTFIVEADTIYISTSGNDSWDGLSPVYNSSSGSGPKATIKNAVEFLAVNGTIYLATGTYNENNIKITSSMRIVGAGRQSTIINGNNGAILDISSSAYVTISNLTFTNGKNNNNGGAIYNAGTLTVNNSIFANNNAYAGGAIYNSGTLTVNNSIFANNTATRGGAIYNVGILKINNCTFIDNLVTYWGGAINNEGKLTIDDSEFTNNTAYGGAAIYNNKGEMAINDSSFTNNKVTSSNVVSGAIENTGSTIKTSIATITNSTFTGNSGGAVDNGGEMTIKDSTFTNNTSSHGGAISTFGTLTIRGSTFTGNTATQSGGAIRNDIGVLEIIDSVFHGNSAGDEGGVISSYRSTVTIFNSIFTNNTARGGGVLHNIGGTVNITKSTFTGNAAIGSLSWGRGGVIYNRVASDPSTGTQYFGAMTITDSVFSGNTAVRGSAIYNTYADLTVVSSVISNNIATGYGGNDGSTIFNERGPVNLLLNWFINNIGNYDIYSEVSSVDANNNWWGNNNGPGSRVYINRRPVDTWMVLTASLDKSVTNIGESVNIMINMWYNNWGEYLDPANGHVPDGVPVDLTSLLEDFLDSTVSLFNGMAQVVFTPNSANSGKISINANGQTILELFIRILDPNHPTDQNNTTENNTDSNTPENNTNTTDTTTNSSSSDGSPGSLSPGTNDGTPTGNSPQEPGERQTPGDTSLSVTSEPGESGESVGESGEQNQKSYEITTNNTGSNDSSQSDTTLVAIAGVILLLILVGVGFYFKK